MRIAIDIDDTITAMPGFFSILTRAVKEEGGSVVIMSSRTNQPEVVRTTAKELKEYGIQYDRLVLIEGIDTAAALCPHSELDWWNKYLWQKVHLCQQERIDLVIEDDEKVVALFRRYAPEVRVLRMIK